MNIYFVCTGNTCRSPMAAAILSHKNVSHIAVRSSGIFATPGADMSEHAKQTLAENKMNTAHAATNVTMEDMQWADLVLTMTEGHKQALLQMYPEQADKIFRLYEYVEAPMQDVYDPYGGDLATYQATFQALEQAIQSIINKLEE
ncbi:protein-tyrosine-phosphatase [Lysinibacillus alkalisoli]|uniref:Protein-tyrosine-phosphatase n=1 Tax=Lysinibacillus alkalisoli TaxID=1911548 RepID=A0A917D7W3_9BACI|nr:low molecular weight protein arginine phosphatase [Lysinibacillus alkalisoli]GGG12483.1 protein-tyrosine-phosphatase [Lysinibacillus alkalisoli]